MPYRLIPQLKLCTTSKVSLEIKSFFLILEMLRIGRRLTDRSIRRATGPTALAGFRDVNEFTVNDLKLNVREMEHENTKGKVCDF